MRPNNGLEWSAVEYKYSIFRKLIRHTKAPHTVEEMCVVDSAYLTTWTGRRKRESKQNVLTTQASAQAPKDEKEEIEW